MDDKAKEILTIENHEKDLSERSMEIDVKNQGQMMREIVSAVKATMRKNNLVSLSAPAIGYKRRIVAIKFDTEIKTLINPYMIVPPDEVNKMSFSRETSPCIPNRTFIMPRNNKVEVMYQRPTGQIEHRTFMGQAAYILQKEMHMLEGITLDCIGLEIFDDFDSATEDEKAEILRNYAESLDLLSKQINEEIQNDAELKQIDDAIEFMKSVHEGKTTLDLEAEE